MIFNTVGPAYRIHTQRLVIRCWQPEDAPLLKAAVDENLDHLRPQMPWAMNEPTDLQTKIESIRRFRGKFDLGQDFVYGIFNQDDTRVLGGTGLHPRIGEAGLEIGYWIHHAYTNKGLATETAVALTQVAFKIDKVDRVEIRCDPENTASARVAEKIGFFHEATLSRRLPRENLLPRDTMIWTMFADQFPNCHVANTKIEAYNVIGQRIL